MSGNTICTTYEVLRSVIKQGVEDGTLHVIMGSVDNIVVMSLSDQIITSWYEKTAGVFCYTEMLM